MRKIEYIVSNERLITPSGLSLVGQVVDNLILLAGHLTDHARKLRLALGHSNGWICTFLRIAEAF